MKQNNSTDDKSTTWWQGILANKDKTATIHNSTVDGTVEHLFVTTHQDNDSTLIATVTENGVSIYSWNYGNSAWKPLINNYELFKKNI